MELGLVFSPDDKFELCYNKIVISLAYYFVQCLNMIEISNDTFMNNNKVSHVAFM